MTFFGLLRSREGDVRQLGLQPGDLAIEDARNGSRRPNKRLVYIGKTYNPGGLGSERRVRLTLLDGSMTDVDQGFRLFQRPSILDRVKARFARQG